MPPLWEELARTAQTDGFLPVASAVFLMAVAHALATPWIGRWTQRRPSAWLHWLAEVEAVFVLWAVGLLLLALVWPGKGGGFVLGYLGADAGPAGSKFVEPSFVFIVMTLASARPVLALARRVLVGVAGWLGGGVAAEWLVVLTLAPLLGSLITEPAAMAIAAGLLAARFFRLGPSLHLRYATLALLFVNVSVGGALTHFAAPPIVMVASVWGWGGMEVFRQFGVAAVATLLLANVVYFVWFRRELFALGQAGDAGPAEEAAPPRWLSALHVAVLAGAVAAFSFHQVGTMLGCLLAFFVLRAVTARWQDASLGLRGPAMVGLFLAGLVVLGGFQGWWIGPLIGRAGESGLLWAAVGLTAFNDNAAITYLAAQVPALAEPGAAALRHALVAGALAGGGLTVLANAPNPAGLSILGRFFPEGVSPWRLAVWALLPTLIAVATFLFLR